MTAPYNSVAGLEVVAAIAAMLDHDYCLVTEILHGSECQVHDHALHAIAVAARLITMTDRDPDTVIAELREHIINQGAA